MRRRPRFGRPGIGRRKKGLFSRLIAVFISVAIIGITFDLKLRPVVRSMAENQAIMLTSQAIDNAVTDVLAQEGTDYDDLVRIETNENGLINSIQSKTVEINQLKSKLSTAIITAISLCEKKLLRIPIGTIIGGDLLSGRGPRLNIYITISASTDVQIANEFESSGINQTRHQIILEVIAKVYILMESGNISTVVDTNYVIAETVIVGTVPDMYVISEKTEQPQITQESNQQTTQASKQ